MGFGEVLRIYHSTKANNYWFWGRGLFFAKKPGQKKSVPNASGRKPVGLLLLFMQRGCSYIPAEEMLLMSAQSGPAAAYSSTLLPSRISSCSISSGRRWGRNGSWRGSGRIGSRLRCLLLIYWHC